VPGSGYLYKNGNPALIEKLCKNTAEKRKKPINYYQMPLERSRMSLIRDNFIRS